MRRRSESMNDEKKSAALGRALLSGPYLIWMIGFTIIPLALIFWFGITNKMQPDTGKHYCHYESGSLEGSVAVSWTVTGQYDPLPDPCLSSCHDPSWKRQFCQRLYCIYLHPSYVDDFLLRTMAWQTLLERNGVINGILTWLHLPKQNLINTPAAIVLGMVYNFLPFMVLPIYNVLAKIDDNTINAAKT